MLPITRWLSVALLGAVFFACEKEFIPPINNEPDQIVVEGYIEGGDDPTPPYVILTRSFPFFSKLGPEQLNNAFVRDAVVTVSDGESTVTLTEICLQDLPPEFREQALQFFGLEGDSVGYNICAYVDLEFRMLGEIGRTYDLRIEAQGQVLTASTTIPIPSPLDSLWFVEPPGEPNDTLAQLRVLINDPAGMHNYYRYFTKINDGPFLTPFSSVTDDRFFDGQRFEFPLAKAEERGGADDDFDIETFGLYPRGDTLTLKWTTIDKAHFDFWNTLEFNASNQGPFSSYTRVDHNVEGGLGIWGGSAVNYYTRWIPTK